VLSFRRQDGTEAAEQTAPTEAVDRRAFVAAVSSLSVAGVAGCLDDDPEPSFELVGVESVQPDESSLFVLTTVQKAGEESGEVRLRAEVQFADAADHGDELTIVVEEDVDERTVVLPFRYDSPILADRTYETRAKIVREGVADGAWRSGNETTTPAE
jgi:hypothetical protein